MRNALACLILIAACSLAWAATGPTVTKAYADDKGIIHIVTAEGHDHRIQPKKWPAGGGFASVQISPDGRMVGWLVKEMLTPEQSGSNYTYAVAQELDVWSYGRVIQRFTSPQWIINWLFVDDKEIAFHAAPLHGDRAFYCVLFDVHTGKQIEQWKLDRRDYVIPAWAKPLIAGESLPDREEIKGWFPDRPVSEKTAPK